MELAGKYILAVVATGGLFAPLLFICFHLIRPFLFIPVIFVCVSGGMLFGTVAGSVYSIVGMTLSSMMFYGLIQKTPNTYSKLMCLKSKLVGERARISTPQVTVLRLIPFIHYHLLSLCLMETSENFREYTKSSFLTNIPFVFVYTFLGQWLATLSPLYILAFLVAILPLLYIVRKKVEYIKWDDFFQLST